MLSLQLAFGPVASFNLLGESLWHVSQLTDFSPFLFNVTFWTVCQRMEIFRVTKSNVPVLLAPTNYIRTVMF